MPVYAGMIRNSNHNTKSIVFSIFDHVNPFRYAVKTEYKNVANNKKHLHEGEIGNKFDMINIWRMHVNTSLHLKLKSIE